MGGVGPGGGWGKWGNHTSPPTNPHSKSSSSRTARGPQGAAKLIQEKKAGAAGAPLPGPHLWGLAKKKGGSGGWKCPPPLRALTPRKEASHPALALQGMLGGTEGRSSFPPPHSFCCHDPYNSLLPTPLQATADDAAALLPLQRTLSHVGPPQGRAQLGHELYAVAARSGPQLSCAPAP